MPERKRERGGRRRLPRSSEAELVVMRAVWGRAPVPVTASGAGEALGRERQWKPKTIHTLLRRLVRKGALGFEKRGREHHFRALVDAAEYAHAASRSFLGRFFDGEIAPFLACFLERERLTPAEIAELKSILDSMKP